MFMKDSILIVDAGISINTSFRQQFFEFMIVTTSGNGCALKIPEEKFKCI